VRLALATAAEPATPLAVAGVIAGRLPRWVFAAGVALLACGVGLAVAMPGPEPQPESAPPPPAVAIAPAPAEGLPDRNLRVLRQELLPRVVEDLRPLALGGGEAAVTRLEALDYRAWFEVELRHRLPISLPATRLRFYLHPDTAGCSVFFDRFGKGDFAGIRPHEPIVLLLQPRLTLRADPLDRALATLRTFPPDRRTTEEAVRQARLVAAVLARCEGTWLQRGNPDLRRRNEAPRTAEPNARVLFTGMALTVRDFVALPDGRVRLLWWPNWCRLSEDGRRLTVEGTDDWYERARE
jgi:hypothetical protein